MLLPKSADISFRKQGSKRGPVKVYSLSHLKIILVLAQILEKIQVDVSLV